jgi:hypothetical protein
MKIDKILGREASDIYGTKYLNLILDDFKDINYIDDLLVSSIINHGAEMDSCVIQQSTIQRIVEL